MITNTVFYTQEAYATTGTYTVNATAADIVLDPFSKSLAFYSVKRGLPFNVYNAYVRINGILYLYRRNVAYGGAYREDSGYIYGEGFVLILVSLPNGDAHTTTISVCQAQVY